MCIVRPMETRRWVDRTGCKDIPAEETVAFGREIRDQWKDSDDFSAIGWQQRYCASMLIGAISGADAYWKLRVAKLNLEASIVCRTLLERVAGAFAARSHPSPPRFQLVYATGASTEAPTEAFAQRKDLVAAGVAWAATPRALSVADLASPLAIVHSVETHDEVARVDLWKTIAAAGL